MIEMEALKKEDLNQLEGVMEGSLAGGGGGGQFELGLKDVQELSNECMMEFQTEKLVCMKQREVR